MSLSFNKNKGRPIAVIVGGKKDGKFIYLDPDWEKEGDDEYICSAGEKVFPLPHFDKTEHIYVAGPTGCGKSYFVAEYVRQLKKKQKKRKVALISDVDADPSIDRIKKLIRVDIKDPELLEKDSIDPQGFKDTVLIFDDIDSIQNKQIANLIHTFKDAVLRRGRHEGITSITTNHNTSDYRNTRVVLNETNAIVMYPRSGATNGIKYVLEKYIGVNKDEVENIMKLKTRWIYCGKHAPQYLVYEKGVYMLN